MEATRLHRHPLGLKAAATWDATKREASFADFKTVLDAMKARFVADPTEFGAIDSWIAHCAVLDAFVQRRLVPDGSMIFGGGALMERRRKGLVTKDEWRAARLRPLVSVGDKDKQGNRHFRLGPDGRSCTVAVYGHDVTLHLPRMHGKWGALLPMLAAVTAANEVSVTFRLGDKLEISFDEMDLRKVPSGVGLQAAKDAEGGRKRGRPRVAGYRPPVPTWTAERPRPVHPEWRDPVRIVPGRAVGIDLNPNWIGMTAVGNDDDLHDLGATTVLDRELVELGLPVDASNETVREALANACNLAVDMARAHGAGTIAVEDGLGKLRSGGRNKPLNRVINGWARNAFVAMLTRRARLAGIGVVAVWGGYSTTVGNLGFALPDACASAAEIGRRGLVVAAGLKHRGLLPAYRTEVGPGLWEDRDLPKAGEILRWSDCWRDAHRGLKAAKLGVRRPHPAPPGPDGRTTCGHAVDRLGRRRRPGRVYRPSKERSKTLRHSVAR